ncbi:PREDICTED: tonsoku-like protein isoform X1 [Nicrophorus vespilloides]|uniref:Tonsoku-like protein n=1 Tax=Nicrophorus vespilloides TaxID=110193 RepID=A0ABM1NHH4_NICVS|nr:PREDICTED: tonsoku-like protein isoform X1 [Nicrophorus vespilloides]
MEEQKLLSKKRKAESEENKTQLAKVCIELAAWYSSKENYQAAINEYQIAADIYHIQEKNVEYGCINRNIGEAYMEIYEFNKALKHHEIHLSVSMKEDDKLEQQRALATIGHTYLTSYITSGESESNKQALELANKCFLRSLKICESLTGINKFEHMDMMARLFANLGVVQEQLGNYEAGIDLLKKSLTICKANDIYVHTERAYSLLGSLYCNMKDYSTAINHYNLAMQVAGLLDDKVSLIGAALVSKADILIKLYDFNGAKMVLLKAYKLKGINAIDKTTLENNLKVVAAMCYTEDELLVTSETDYAKRKKLFEKMGDGASMLKIYAKAIEYYQKMLQTAESNGDSGKELSACYVSLAQTYMDDEKFDLALKFFRKEYDLLKANPSEVFHTLFNIVELMELLNAKVDDIVIELNKARVHSMEANDKHMEGKVLNRLIGILRKHNRFEEANALEADLEEVDYTPSSDSESEEVGVTQNIGDDIDLDNITDLSDESDNEEVCTKPRTRKRKNGLLIKRNAKGETQLHTACIAGKELFVKKLLDQGHVVNIRDNCGWLPIHEACICGHLEIVRMLVQKGALINDRGGAKCLGMTPLHDAASNGHLEVIEYLLDNGASAVAKTDEGETPLQTLRSWRQRVDLDPIEQTYFETIVHRITSALERTGQSTADVISNKENKAYTLIDEDSPTFFDDDLQPRNATEVYKTTISNLRTRSSSNSELLPRKRSSLNLKRSALLEPNEVGDDWLEDDLGSSVKKRKLTQNPTSESYKLMNTLNSKLSQPQNSKDISSQCSIKKSSSSKFGLSSMKRKSQTTLITAGFTRRRSSSPKSFDSDRSQSPVPTFSRSKHNVILEKSNFEEPDSTTGSIMPASQVETKIKQMLFVDVRIEGKLFRIPVPIAELETLTVKWLSNEAMNRFYKKEAIKPVIELETNNGAMLCEDDLISILFPFGVTTSEEVLGKVIKWNIPPIQERYKDSCATLKKDCNKKLFDLLDSSSTVLNLKDQHLGVHLIPLCKAINRQKNLFELNLTGNYMTPKCIDLLCESLSTLDNLTKLNLSLNNLKVESLELLANILEESSQKPILYNLNDLDLSFNPLTNESFKHISTITKHLKLKSLNLCSVEFTKSVFGLFFNKNLRLNLDACESLDLSCNDLDVQSLLRFINWMDPMNLKSLSVGYNSGIKVSGFASGFIEFIKTSDIGLLNVKTLNLNGCRIGDEETIELISSLMTAINLEDLDLSSNDLNFNTLIRLLEDLSLSNLDVRCCKNLAVRTEDERYEIKLNVGRKCKNLMTTLNYTEHFSECDILINLWKREYEELYKVEGIESERLYLSVREE